MINFSRCMHFQSIFVFHSNILCTYYTSSLMPACVCSNSPVQCVRWMCQCENIHGFNCSVISKTSISNSINCSAKIYLTIVWNAFEDVRKFRFLPSFSLSMHLYSFRLHVWLVGEGFSLSCEMIAKILWRYISGNFSRDSNWCVFFSFSSFAALRSAYDVEALFKHIW